MSKIRICHWADFHLGVDNIGATDPVTTLNGRVLDYLDALDALVDFAEENDADLALFAGDAFHTYRPDPTYVREFAERIVRLSEQCPVVLLIGNHDMPPVLERAGALDLFGTLPMNNIHVGYDYDVHRIDTKRGMIQVATAPFPLKSMFLSDKERRKLREEQQQILQQRVSNKIIDLAEQIDEESPAVLLGHFTVTGIEYGSENGVLFGTDGVVALDVLTDQTWSYIALGHIHKRQCLHNGNPPVVYAGSLERVNFGEEYEAKGFVWIEIQEDWSAKWEFIDIDTRPWTTISIDVSQSKKPARDLLMELKQHDVQGAIVRLRIVAGTHPEVSLRLREVADYLEKAGVFAVHSIRPMYTSAPRLGGISIDGPVYAQSPMQLIEDYFSERETDKRERKALIDLARELMSEVDSERRIPV